MAKVEDTPQFKKFFKNLRKLTDDKTVVKTIKASPEGKALIGVLIGQAVAGFGPGQTAYATHSPEYKKRKSAATGAGRFFLRGIKRTGRTGGMLDPKNFDYETTGGRIFLVWRPVTDETGNMGTYAGVHQEGNDTTPKRTWMHLRSPAHVRAVLNLFKAVYKKLAARIKAGDRL